MHPNRKTAQIDRLAGAIEYIGASFERFAGIFLQALLEVPMNHQGVNLFGYPVAAVIDSISDDGNIAAEYTDEAGYFDGDMAKAESDLRNALRRKPSAKEIFLLSARRKRPIKAQDFETKVMAWPEMTGKTLHLWGAEDIASHILNELIFNDTVVRCLSSYLPELERISDEEAASRMAPAPDRRSLPRDGIDSEMSRRLSLSPVLAISGIGGLGKSAMAAQYAARHESEFDLVIWLDSDEVRRPEQLQALSLIRGGEARNVASLLKSRACLLIIDDIAADFPTDRLETLCGPDSRIILTQRMVTPDSFQLPMLDRHDARILLNQDGTDCPPEVFDTIWSVIGGHPLSLGLINAAVREGATWPEILLDCEAPGDMDDRGQTLAQRLLGRLHESLSSALSIFVWAGQPSCGHDFLLSVIKPAGVRKLRSHGLTAVDRSDFLRLHDVVFAALSPDWCPPSRHLELNKALEDYLISVSREPGLRLWTIARILRPKLEALLQDGAASPAFRYALLAVWDPSQLKGDLIGDPVAQAQMLVGVTPPRMAISAIIEAIEQLWLSDSLESQDAAKTRLASRLPVFELLATLPSLTDLESTEIQHHKAKALKRLGEASEASVLFEAVLNGPRPLHEARLQLIDIYRKHNANIPRVIELVDEIFALEPGASDVTYSVLLGMIERLPWGEGTWRGDLIYRHAAVIERTVIEAANVGVQQAYGAFAALGRFLSTEDPDMFFRIWSQLPEPAVDHLESDSERFAWGEIYFEASRLAGADTARLQLTALGLYESIGRPSGFHRQRLAELLIEMGRAEEGQALLDVREELPTSEWLQRLMARAHFAQGDPKGALEWINKALEGLKTEHFRSEFLELRFDIRTALNDPLAREDLVAALKSSQKAREKARLEARLATFPN